MKQVLLFFLVFLGLNGIQSQTIEIFDKKLESDGVCIRSFRVRIINEHPRVNQIYALSYRQSKENPYGYPPVSPAYSKVLDRKVRTLPNGSEVYETGVIRINTLDTYMNIEVKGQYRRGFRKETHWSKKIKLTKCELTGFKRYILIARGETLEEAQYNQCKESNGGTTDINLKLSTTLTKGKLYSKNNYFYEVRDVYTPSPGIDYTSTSWLFTGPYSRYCVDTGDDGGDENQDTSNYDLQIKESDVFVYSACVSCPSQLDILNPGFLGGTFPIRKHLMSTEGNTVQTQFLIKNVGPTTSKKAKVNFYMSTGYNSIFGVKAVGKTVEVPNISSGGEFLVNPIFQLSDFNVQLGRYYLVIDIETAAGESTTTNNYVSIPMEVKSAAGKTPKILDSNNKPYEVSVYNFDGTRYFSKVVHNSKEEEEITEELPKGLYIVKSSKKTYKVAN